MKRLLPVLLLTACLPAFAGRQAVGEWEGVPLYRLQVERLPDMSVPRCLHSLYLAPDGSLLAFGGHATGFLPLSSAEVFRGGKWRELPPMHYSHDCGFLFALPEGSILLGGGFEEAFGRTPSLGAEMFTPATGQFNPWGILPGKRAAATALAMPDGSALISGNWFAPDNLVRFDRENGFTVVKQVREERRCPYMFPVSGGDDVLIFGGMGKEDEVLEGWVDRLEGEPFRPALFQEYLPIMIDGYSTKDASLDGDTYLFPVRRRSDGQVAIAMVKGLDFSIPETDHPVPMTLPDGTPILWNGVLMDRPVRKAYMLGLTCGHGVAVWVLDYDPLLDGGVGRTSLLLAPEREGPFPYEATPVLLRSGQIALVGGRMEDNFHPVASAFILHAEEEDALARSSVPLWIWGLLLLVFSGAAAGVYFARKRTSAPAAEPARPDLLSRIVTLMEERQFYLRKDIRIADVAAELGTNSTYISACLNGQLGKGFSDFVAEYRVRHAKELLARHPDLSMAQVADESGFPSERSFYRHFKNLTGKTPAEWRGV